MVKHALAISASQGAISSLQVFKALFRIPSGPSAVLFKRRLIVLAISSIIMSLSTLRRVTGVLPMMSLRSAGAGQGKNLFIRIFTFLSLLLVACGSSALYRGGKCGSSTRRPTFFFAHFTMAQRPLLQGRLGLKVYSFINRLQLFLASFFRVFFNWFLVSLYRLSFLGLWLLVYFLLACYWLAIRTAHCMDHACRARQLYSRVQHACLSRPLPQFSSIQSQLPRPKGLGGFL